MLPTSVAKTTRQKANKKPQNPTVADVRKSEATIFSSGASSERVKIKIPRKKDQLKAFAFIPDARDQILAPSERYPNNEGEIKFAKLQDFDGKDVMIYSAWTVPNKYGQVKVWFNIDNNAFVVSDMGSAFSRAVFDGLKLKIPEEEKGFFDVNKHMLITTYKNRFGKIAYSNKPQQADISILDKIRDIR